MKKDSLAPLHSYNNNQLLSNLHLDISILLNIGEFHVFLNIFSTFFRFFMTLKKDWDALEHARESALSRDFSQKRTHTTVRFGHMNL